MDDAKKYERRKYAVEFAAFAIDVVILIYVLVSGLTFRFRDYAQSVTPSPWISVLVYGAILGGILKLIQLPIQFYSGYIVEHQFGLSHQNMRAWLKDRLISLGIGSVLGLGALEIVYYFMRLDANRWWLYTGGIFVGFAIVMTNLAPVLLLPLFFKFRPIENHELLRRVQRLAHRTGTRLCGIFEWSLGEKTRKANAAVVGWGNTRRIIVSDTLLQRFSAEEIEVIMAHELCHHVKHHLWQAIGIQSGLTFAGFYVVHRLLDRFYTSFGFQGPADVANFPFLMLIATGLSLLVLPAVNAFSRKLERAADLYALDVTSDSLAFVSSMEKLAELNLASVSPNRIIEFIFHSHPSVESRIRMAVDRAVPTV